MRGIVNILRKVGSLIDGTLQLLADYVLIPLGRALLLMWDRIVYPAVLHTLYRIVDALHRLIVPVLEFLLYRVLQPLWCFVTEIVSTVWHFCTIRWSPL